MLPITSYQYHDRLQSERLVTRFLTAEDVSAWTEFFQNEEAIGFFPDHGFTTPEEWSRFWIERQLARYRENRFGLQALLDKKTGAFVGQCGLLLQEVDGTPELEVGYDIFKKFWGRGYAPEAATLFIDHAFQNNLAPSVVSVIDTQNTKAQSVARKIGMQKDRQTKWMDHDVFIYRIRNKKK